MRPTFEEAKATYVHRFTCEHVPEWARGYLDDTANPPKFYAPHYRTDREWYEASWFPGEDKCPDKTHCVSKNKSWPHSTALAEQFVIGKTPVKWKPKQLVLLKYYDPSSGVRVVMCDDNKAARYKQDELYAEGMGGFEREAIDGPQKLGEIAAWLNTLFEKIDNDFVLGRHD